MKPKDSEDLSLAIKETWRTSNIISSRPEARGTMRDQVGDLDSFDHVDLSLVIRQIQMKEARLKEELKRAQENQRVVEKTYQDRENQFRAHAQALQAQIKHLQDAHQTEILRYRQKLQQNEANSKEIVQSSNAQAQKSGQDLLRLQQQVATLRAHIQYLTDQYQELQKKAQKIARKREEAQERIQKRLHEAIVAHQKCYEFAQNQVQLQRALEKNLFIEREQKHQLTKQISEVSEELKQWKVRAKASEGEASRLAQEVQSTRNKTQWLESQNQKVSESNIRSRQKFVEFSEAIREIHRSLRGYFESNPDQMNPLFRERVGRLLTEQLRIEIEKLDQIEAILKPESKTNEKDTS